MENCGQLEKFYFIIPIEKARVYFGDCVDLTRVNKNASLCIWDLLKTDEMCAILQADISVLCYDYDQLLEILKTDEWKPKNPWD